MRTHSIYLVSAILVLCPNLSAQWVKTAGPDSGNVGAIAVSGTDVFVGTGFTFFGVHGAKGIFRTTDNGASWTAANSGLTDTCVFSLAVGGTNILAGTLCDGVFRSTDNGTSWTATSLKSALVTSFAASPAPGGAGATNLFAGSPGPT